jgi:uncharacterized protein (TIGR03437 family)
MTIPRWAALVLALVLVTFAPAQTYTISTYAGGAPPPTPAAGTSLSIGSPQGVATDAAGNVYFASGHCVFKLDTGGVLTRVAGNCREGYSGDGGPATSAQLNEPYGVAVDSAGNLYIAEWGNNRVRKVTPGGIISTRAGNGIRGYSGDGGPATSAQLTIPQDVAVDSDGNLYIADSGNRRIRKVTPSGTISTVAGGGTSYPGDGGPATSAQLFDPSAIATDSAGNLYIADGGIRKVTPSGTISTVAGGGTSYPGDGGPATSAQLGSPQGVAVDSAGNLYIADNANHRIRKVTPGGIISTVAGNGSGGYSGDFGPAINAQLNFPTGVAVDSAGNLYMADFNNHRIRKVTPSGFISPVAGNQYQGYSGDGGPATNAQLNNPEGIAVDSAGNVYIADYFNQRIRRVTQGGIISTVAGKGNFGYSGDGDPATGAELSFPSGVAVDSAGNLYIADSFNQRIRKVTPAGIISTVAGNGSNGYSGDGGPATSAQLYNPSGVAVDSASNIYIADSLNQRIRKVTPAGIITTVAGNGSGGYSGDGRAATNAQLNVPSGVTVDSNGNLYIADATTIRMVTPGGIISTVAGGGTSYPGDGGPATSAQLSGPQSVAVDSAGNLYIAEWGHNRVRKVTPGGIISTTAGNGIQGYSGDGGAATSAQLQFPQGIAVGSSGKVYIADTLNNAIRVLQPSGTAPAAPVITPGGIVPLYSSVNTIQPGEWISIYGSNFANTITGWDGTFTNTLGGVSVTINGKAAWLSYVSPLQINAQAPDDTATGTVSVVVTAAAGTATGTVTLAPFAPSLALLDDKHVAGIILRPNGSGAYGGGSYDIIGPTGTSLGYRTVAAKAGDTIALYAVGLGPTNPSVPSGTAFTGAAPTTNPVKVLISGTSVTPSFAGLSGAGLDQLNLTVPVGLGTGDVSVAALVGGLQTQSGVVISLQ